METVARVQVLDGVVCISHTLTFLKNIFKIDIVSHTAHVGLGYIYIYLFIITQVFRFYEQRNVHSDRMHEKNIQKILIL